LKHIVTPRQQQLTLPNGHVIDYCLELRQRRTIGLKITQQGLVVHAPKRILAHQLQQILVEKSDWIQSKLALREQNQIAPIQWVDGEPLLFLGKDIFLQVLKHSVNKAPILEGERLVVRTTQPDNQTYIARKIMQWYAQQALPDFKRRVDIIAAQMTEKVSHVALSNAKMRWGSCNSRKEIRLNWRLIQAPPHMIHYVVCHEMAHLREMNHSAKFYAVLEALYPQHAKAEKELKAFSSMLHRMA
jgi:predicted metal-dependent hydrolase